jgi:hypothetical protein
VSGPELLGSGLDFKIAHYQKSVTMTSSRLCKNAEGAGFPFQVEALEDGVDDAVHALHVHEADHGPSTTAYFHETTLHEVGAAQLLPQVSGEAEEGQPFLAALGAPRS